MLPQHSHPDHQELFHQKVLQARNINMFMIFAIFNQLNINVATTQMMLLIFEYNLCKCSCGITERLLVWAYIFTVLTLHWCSLTLNLSSIFFSVVDVLIFQLPPSSVTSITGVETVAAFLSRKFTSRTCNMTVRELFFIIYWLIEWNKFQQIPSL